MNGLFLTQVAYDSLLKVLFHAKQSKSWIVPGITSQVVCFFTKTQKLFWQKKRRGSVDVSSCFPTKLRRLTKSIYAKPSREIQLDFVLVNFGMFVA